MLGLILFALFATTFVSVAVDLHWAQRFHKWFMDETSPK